MRWHENNIRSADRCLETMKTAKNVKSIKLELDEDVSISKGPSKCYLAKENMASSLFIVILLNYRVKTFRIVTFQQ